MECGEREVCEDTQGADRLDKFTAIVSLIAPYATFRNHIVFIKYFNKFLLNILKYFYKI
jgi:hypothetical protein